MAQDTREHITQEIQHIVQRRYIANLILWAAAVAVAPAALGVLGTCNKLYSFGCCTALGGPDYPTGSYPQTVWCGDTPCLPTIITSAPVKVPGAPPAGGSGMTSAFTPVPYILRECRWSFASCDGTPCLAGGGGTFTNHCEEYQLSGVACIQPGGGGGPGGGSGGGGSGGGNPN